MSLMQRAEAENLRLSPFSARAKWDTLASGSRDGARLKEMALPSERTMLAGGSPDSSDMPIARTDRTQTEQSMQEQAAEMGVTVPRDMRRKAKAEIARYIDEQLSK
jgi:hypothetical protein